MIRASVDDFHNPQNLRYARGRYSPDGFYLDSYDYDAFRRLLLDPLSPSGSGRYAAKRFDLDNDRPFDLEWRQAAPAAVLIVDGIFLHRPELRPCWDLSIFLKVDFDVSLPRGAARGENFDAIDPNSPPHLRYVGGQKRYLAECAPAQQADIVIVRETAVRQTIVDTILKHARTGAVGDGKVFVLPVEEAYRVRTGEAGEEVLQAHPDPATVSQ